MEITNEVRIPYDIDPLFDGGCREKDLWGDDYGDEVLLLVSDSGSAYMCPEKAGGDWRVYIGANGARRIEGAFDGDDRDEMEVEDAAAEVGEILSCAYEAGINPKNIITGMLGSPAGAPAFMWQTVEGREFLHPGLQGFFEEVFGDPPSFEDGWFTYSIPDERMRIESGGIMVGAYQECFGVDEMAQPMCNGPYHFLGANGSVIESAELFVKEMFVGSSDPAEKMAIAFANKVIADAVRAHKEIEAFEKVCEQKSND